MFRWCQPEIGHKLTRDVDTIEISDLGHHRDGDDGRDSTHSLDRFDNWHQRPTRKKGSNLACRSLNPGFGVSHRVDVVLQYDLLRRMLE